MALPDLESLTDGLIATCDAIVGDAMQWRLPGGAFEPVRGFVDYGEALRDIDTGRLVEQAITVTLSKLECAIRPNENCRMILGRIPTMQFRPVNVMDKGTDWQFEVKRA